MNMHIKKSVDKLPNHRGELKWEEIEAKRIRERIFDLRPDQIGALCYLVGVEFSFDDLSEVVSEIKENLHDSINIGAIVYEAESKEKLFWWLGYFEKTNKN